MGTKFLYQNGYSHGQCIVFSSLQETVFEDPVDTLNAIVGVDTDKETISPITASPSLKVHLQVM
jgi:hypothetical protein